MKTVKDKEKFLELRAGGMSFAKISQAIGVSKPILIKWNLEFGKEIENRRFLAAEELIEQYNLMQMSRIQVFGEMLNRALDELKNRDFSLAPLKDLLTLINQLEGKLVQECRAIQYSTDQRTSFLDIMREDDNPIKIGLFAQK